MLHDMLDIGPLQWAAAILGALLAGFAKAGIGGVGTLFVALFATAFPSTRQATGIVLPLLILGDWIAVTAYRRHLQWRHLGKLFPWTAAGVVAGYFALGHMSDRWAKTLIGAIIVAMSSMSYWQRFRSGGRGPQRLEDLVNKGKLMVWVVKLYDLNVFRLKLRHPGMIEGAGRATKQSWLRENPLTEKLIPNVGEVGVAHTVAEYD